MADTLDQLIPAPVQLKLDKGRTLQLNWYGWKHLERHYGSFLAVWTVLFRLINSTVATAYLRSLAGDRVDEVLAAAKIMADTGPILDDVAVVLWACCLEEADDSGERLTVRQIERYLKPAQLREYLDAIKLVVEGMAPSENPPAPAP